MLAPGLFLAAVLPLSLVAAISDLRTMTIPNWVSLALVGAFIVLAPFVLPWESIAWRLGAAVAVLTVGFFINAAGQLGGGDAKYLAAITPYISAGSVAQFMFIFSLSLLGTLLLHKIAKSIPAIRRATPDWASWSAGRKFPMGTSIAVAIVAYLIMLIANG